MTANFFQLNTQKSIKTNIKTQELFSFISLSHDKCYVYIMKDNRHDFNLFKEIIFGDDIKWHDVNPGYFAMWQEKLLLKTYHAFLHFIEQSKKGIGLYKILDKRDEFLGIVGIDEKCPLFEKITHIINGQAKGFLYLKKYFSIGGFFSKRLYFFLKKLGYKFLKSAVYYKNKKSFFATINFLNGKLMMQQPISCNLQGQVFSCYIFKLLF